MPDVSVWLPIAVVLVSAVLFCVQVPLWGVGPLWLKQVWTRIIRLFKRGDVRTWNFTEVEPGLFVGSLPRSPEDLAELQTGKNQYKLGAIVSLVEPWEIAVTAAELQALDIQHLLLPTPDYSTPRLIDVEDAVAFIDRQV